MPDDSEVSVEVKVAAGVDEDLAIQIAHSLPKNAREQITCKRVTEHHYRCNWWTLDNTATYDNPAMTGSIVTTGRIGRSQFLHAVKIGGELRIRVLTR